MRQLVVGTALTWLFVVSPSCHLLATTSDRQGSDPGARPGGRNLAVSALELTADGFATTRLASKPSPQQDPQTLAVLGGRVHAKPALLSTPADPLGYGARSLLLRLHRPQRGPPSPSA